MKYTNYSNISLPIAIWLATDNYDYDPRPNAISATTLLKPIKSVILTKRLTMDASVDVLDLLPSRLGSAIHDSVEQAIRENYRQAMQDLGIPDKVIDTVYIDPPVEMLEDGNIYDLTLEQRSEREVDDFIIGGKFDVVANRQVRDTKTTKVYNWIHGGNDEKYRLQGSIYRWLNPDLILDDEMVVDMLFTDWSPLKAQADKKYPPRPIMERKLKLLTIQETDCWIRQRLDLLRRYWDEDQQAIPACTPEEVWQKETTYAWYKDPAKRARSTKNFTSLLEAQQHSKGVGVIVERPGDVKFCSYCPAKDSCLQAAEYREQGLLKD